MIVCIKLIFFENYVIFTFLTFYFALLQQLRLLDKFSGKAHMQNIATIGNLGGYYENFTQDYRHSYFFLLTFF